MLNGYGLAVRCPRVTSIDNLLTVSSEDKLVNASVLCPGKDFEEAIVSRTKETNLPQTPGDFKRQDLENVLEIPIGKNFQAYQSITLNESRFVPKGLSVLLYLQRKSTPVYNTLIVYCDQKSISIWLCYPTRSGLLLPVNVDWELSDTLCDFYIAVDVTCSTASIFNLVAISIDRFIAVTQPIKYSKHKNNNRVALTIAIVWIVSAAIGSPIVLGLNTTPERIPQLCIFYNSDFIIYSSLSSFYIPCLVMVFLYYKIFKAIHERARKAAAKKHKQANLRPSLVIENTAQTQPLKETKSHASSGAKSNKAQQLQVVVETDALTTNTGSGSQEDEDDETLECRRPSDADSCHIIPNEKATNFAMSTVLELRKDDEPIGVNGTTDSGYVASNVEETQFFVQNPHVNLPAQSLVPIDVRCNNRPPAFKNNGSARSVDNISSRRAGCDTHEPSLRLPHVKKSRFNLGKKHKSSRKKREKASAKRERKATKTLAIVLGVFLICWVPFFTCNIMDAICIKLQSGECRPGITAFLLTTWLGYMNSCVNPVIYTIFNPEFRKAFKKILMEPCK